MLVESFYRLPLIIDGEEIVLRIKRMTMEENGDFLLHLKRVGFEAHNRFVSRASSGPEQKRNSKGKYLIPFSQIVEDRISEMSPEKREELNAAEELHEKKAQEFLRNICDQFVTVERGLIEKMADGTEKSVIDGLDFLRIFGFVCHRVFPSQNQVKPHMIASSRRDDNHPILSRTVSVRFNRYFVTPATPYPPDTPLTARSCAGEPGAGCCGRTVPLFPADPCPSACPASG